MQGQGRRQQSHGHDEFGEWDWEQQRAQQGSRGGGRRDWQREPSGSRTWGENDAGWRSQGASADQWRESDGGTFAGGFQGGSQGHGDTMHTGSHGFGRQGYGGDQSSFGEQHREDFRPGWQSGEQHGSHRGWEEGAGQESRSHRGRGPKGYRRSDDRIREEICDCFTDDHELDPSEIEVQVKDGEVTLTGTVECRHAKRRAEDLACEIRGVNDVHNQIRLKHNGGGEATKAEKPHDQTT
jgi:hypothetical protein